MDKIMKVMAVTLEDFKCNVLPAILNHTGIILNQVEAIGVIIKEVTLVNPILHLECTGLMLKRSGAQADQIIVSL
jgi:hypothetical protein